MVATPIGNLADVSLRALHVLALVEAVACEDTRQTQSLLRGYGIDRPGSSLIAVHQHNEREGAQAVMTRLLAGDRVAMVSDAGTPAISDPGSVVVAAVRAAGLGVIPIPGVSSVTTALSVAGCVDAAAGGFVFDGFLPARGAEREQRLDALARDLRTVVLLEAPHRVVDLAQSLARLGMRQITVARELTKQFEAVVTLNAADWPAWLAQDANRSRGEFVVVLHPMPRQATEPLDTRTLELLLAELPVKTAVRLAAEITGQARNALYAAALELRRDRGMTPDPAGPSRPAAS